jgi:hypothetical protein
MRRSGVRFPRRLQAKSLVSKIPSSWSFGLSGAGCYDRGVPLVAPGPHLHGTFNTAAVPAATNSPTTSATQAIPSGPRGRIHIGCHGWSPDDTERGLRDRRGASQPGEAQPGHTDAAVEVCSLGALAVINVTDNGVGGASLAAATGWPGRPAARRGWHHDRLVTGRRTDLADRNPPPGSGLTPTPLHSS